jgi:hypothetical protein
MNWWKRQDGGGVKAKEIVAETESFLASRMRHVRPASVFVQIGADRLRAQYVRVRQNSLPPSETLQRPRR